MLKSLCICLVVLLCAVGVYGQEPVVETTPCFDEPYGFLSSCGFVQLPQDYDNPDAGSVELYYIQIRSSHPNPKPDPLVYLVGGPGSSGSSLLQSSFRAYLRPFASDRDVIVIDQRGTGFSSPNLSCKEALYQLDDILQSTADTHAEVVLAMLTDCYNRLVAHNIQLNAFHSQNNARDIVNVLQSLGYEQWNLVGVSYGSRLALTMMRDYPQYIRSVILDSVYPLEADLYVDAYYHGERALNVLFDSCAQDADCNKNYPDLRTVFYNLYDRLNETPIVARYTPPRYRELEIEISGYRLYDWVFSWLYSTNSIRSIPRLIYDLDSGYVNNIVRIGTLYEASLTNLSLGMHYSVQCQEEYISSESRDYEGIQASFPHLSGYLSYAVEGMTTVDRLCGLWQTQARDITANSPVNSDIPTLLLSGNYDPITPPDYAEKVDAVLGTSYNYVLPHSGHGVLRTEACAVDIALAFIDAPYDEPDSRCIASTKPLVFN